MNNGSTTTYVNLCQNNKNILTFGSDGQSVRSVVFTAERMITVLPIIRFIEESVRF